MDLKFVDNDLIMFHAIDLSSREGQECGDNHASIL